MIFPVGKATGGLRSKIRGGSAVNSESVFYRRQGIRAPAVAGFREQGRVYFKVIFGISANNNVSLRDQTERISTVIIGVGNIAIDANIRVAVAGDRIFKSENCGPGASGALLRLAVHPDRMFYENYAVVRYVIFYRRRLCLDAATEVAVN